MSKFVINRKDLINTVDEVVLESEGLTIGRISGNDLLLNDRAVSRTHAGIKDVNGEFWIFNLSTSNGTLLNGELVDKTPLIDDDVIQVGPYFLRIKHEEGALSITVERKLDQGLVSIDLEVSGTVFLNKSSVGQVLVTRAGTKRVSGTGVLTSFLPPLDEQALHIFWDKRKREAGKIKKKTLLRPAGKKKVGKTQFNWYPTLDLKAVWRRPGFIWGAIIVVLLSATGLIVRPQAFSPDETSDVHSSLEMSAAGIAVQPNGNSCSSCHSLLVSMRQKCAECHTTPVFDSSFSQAHSNAGVTCLDCHGEHMGGSFRAGIAAGVMCMTCHNDGFRFQGKVLGTPHGGDIGYPVEKSEWVWDGIQSTSLKEAKPAVSLQEYGSRERFHLAHSLLRCTDCHEVRDRSVSRFRQAPRDSCATCHEFSNQATNNLVGPNCASCHQQHGSNKNLLYSPRAAEKEEISFQLALQYLGLQNKSSLLRGGAENIRQNRSGATFLTFFSYLGAVPGYAWISLLGLLPVIGFVVIVLDTRRRKNSVTTGDFAGAEIGPSGIWGTGTIDLARIEADGPSYPHPIVDPELCIGCHACVEACPHDVLAMVNGVSTPVASDQCMEDTACEVECPTQPKACIVVNATKKIPKRKVPVRNKSFMTNVEGVYLIGDISGVPLIKNAMNEGAQVIDEIVEVFGKEGSSPNAEYDVAIIGIGPGGLSATASAKEKGLKYVAIEQDRIASLIQNYPAGKYVFFKPETSDLKSNLPLPGPGQLKEVILQKWMDVVSKNHLEIHEEEACKAIKLEDTLFVVTTEKGKTKDQVAYKVRKVILAIGNRGTPMKLGAPGEEIKILVEPPQAVIGHCSRCGTALRKGQSFCANCGETFETKKKTTITDRYAVREISLNELKNLMSEDLEECPNCGARRKAGDFCIKCGARFEEKESEQPFLDNKVKYKLSDPDDYVDKKCLVVGGGNSAVEAAVDLCGFKRLEEGFTFIRNNEVTLAVRSDFKGDLKLGNKMNIYDCIDAGKVKVYFGAAVKEILEKELVLMQSRTKKEIGRFPNDYVFALIGGQRPTKFLENIGIKIG